MIPQNDNAIIPMADASQLSDNLWRALIAYLKSQDQKADLNSLIAVSKQLSALWRENAVTLHIPLHYNGPQDLEGIGDPGAIDNGALDSIERDALSTFKDANFVTIQVESGALHWPKDYNHRLAARGFPPCGNAMSIDLRLANTTSFNRALEVMRACPAVARRVTLLSIVEVEIWSQQISIEEVWELIQCLPNLKALNLGGVDVKRVDSAWLLQLATLEGLCHLEVSLDRDFTPQGLEGLASSSLQSLTLTSVHSPVGLVEHIANMPHLKWLTLQLLSQTNKVAELLAQASFDKIEYLDIWSTDAVRPLIDALARSFSNLKELTLGCYDDIEAPSELESLSALASLEYLEVAYVNNVTQEAVNALVAKMPKLRKLGIRSLLGPQSGINPASNLQGESVSIRIS